MNAVSLDVLRQECERVLALAGASPLTPGLRVGLYGAGFLGGWTISWLRKNGVEPVACFDGDSRRHGEMFHGVKILSPQDPLMPSLDLVLITARHAVAQVEAVLERHGGKGCSLDACFVALEFTAFRHVHDHLLSDERSRLTLRHVLMAMLRADRRYLEAVFEKDQYFSLSCFAGAEKESYVDAGAYVGDSVERFIWTNAGVFSKIRAFEPSARQFHALERRVARLQDEWALDDGAIEINRAALAGSAMTMSATTASGQLQSMALTAQTGGDMIAVSLDEHLAGERVTFIKADVEGMEMELLRGAAGTIERFRPKLAICVYHYPSDIPEISAFIQALVPQYRFALRHHSPQLMETVLYCWTEQSSD